MKLDTLKYILKSLILLVWIIISGYICIGGLSMIESIEKVKPIQNKAEIDIVRDITMFQGPIEMLPAHGEEIITNINQSVESENKEKLTFEEEEAIKDLAHVYWYYGYPGYSFILFLTILPYTVLLFLTVGAAGLLGSVVKIIYDHINKTVLLKDSMCFSEPVFGFFLGIMVLAISYVIPTIFVRGDTIVNMTSVVFICFFSGVFSKRFFEWITNLISKFLSTSKSESE